MSLRAIIQILFYTILSIAVKAQLNNAFDSFEKQAFLAPASYSICVLDARGEKVYAKYEQKLLMPASSQKVLTTASAFCLLGENYQYNTQLAYSGAIANQKLNGDLFIIGSGDPTLGSKHFLNLQTPQSILANWKDAIKNSGINTINGNIIPDVSCFQENDVPQTWLWEDIGNYYGAAATGLNFMDNEYELSFNEDRKMGEACSIINASGLEKHYE
ncbi:MAG: D-alanyl-D-alanine carboxypeptidase, partial [Chitinophagales bacterium]|nr:D-alanyl-D-alanine carboxypeptidase [Chitinophagales bacterium]